MSLSCWLSVCACSPTAVPALRAQLGKLLVAGALTDRRVQQLPEAALILATVPGVSDCSILCLWVIPDTV
jgi:hypothetical protein